ncbi:MAG TPA: phosphoribosylanthranilate isomerase [Bacteroidota bacterium]|nr:phosphoribosylanthranilate isomerase [Bacteroidota bacterium]
MYSVKIKICGITNHDDALACAEAGADYLGFIFYAGSRRYVAPLRAARIIASLPQGVIPVGVFVDESPGAIERAIGDSGVRMVQLSGNESPETYRQIPLPMIKVIRASAGTEPSPWSDRDGLFARMVDGSGPGVFGGSGMAPDLSLACKLAGSGRLFLAGGLHPGNVAAQIARIRPFAVDVTSGTEMRPGVKDHSLVSLFCTNVRSAYTH